MVYILHLSIKPNKFSNAIYHFWQFTIFLAIYHFLCLWRYYFLSLSKILFYFLFVPLHRRIDGQSFALLTLKVSILYPLIVHLQPVYQSHLNTQYYSPKEYLRIHLLLYKNRQNFLTQCISHSKMGRKCGNTNS